MDHHKNSIGWIVSMMGSSPSTESTLKVGFISRCMDLPKIPKGNSLSVASRPSSLSSYIICDTAQCTQELPPSIPLKSNPKRLMVPMVKNPNLKPSNPPLNQRPLSPILAPLQKRRPPRPVRLRLPLHLHRQHKLPKYTKLILFSRLILLP